MDDITRIEEKQRRRKERLRSHAQHIIDAGSMDLRPIVENAIGRVISLPTSTGLADFQIEEVYTSSVSVLNFDEGPSIHKSIPVLKVRLRRALPHTTRTGALIPEERWYKLAGEIIPFLT